MARDMILHFTDEERDVKSLANVAQTVSKRTGFKSSSLLTPEYPACPHMFTDSQHGWGQASGELAAR